jgi:hypothetical protein
MSLNNKFLKLVKMSYPELKFRDGDTFGQLMEQEITADNPTFLLSIKEAMFEDDKYNIWITPKHNCGIELRLCAKYIDEHHGDVRSNVIINLLDGFCRRMSNHMEGIK